MKQDNFADSRERALAITAAIARAARDAILDHKLHGDPIVVWQDGQVVWIPADEIVVPELPTSDEPQLLPEASSVR